jgi:NAD(P)-dependent dehydrogenase (short-subunit alcohol dehydrogenase family)
MYAMTTIESTLEGKVALVAGATRGAGRGIAVQLGAAGATVYVTGRTTRETPSEMRRPETIEDTADLVDAAGGTGIPIAVDHLDPVQVRELVAWIATEQEGRLDILVNDIWGGDALTGPWGKPFWEHDLADGLRLQRLGVETHLVTSWHCAPLLAATRGSLVVEVTDGVDAGYRGNFFYDLAKSQVIRAAVGQAADFAPHGVTAVALTPGFLRSEAVLDHFGVTEATWRDAVARDRHFVLSETPTYVGRAVAALAGDPDRHRWTGQALSSWQLAKVYGFTDADGSRPDWGRYFAEVFLGGQPYADDYRGAP